MKKPYTHLTKHDRDLIAVLKAEKRSLRYIAKRLNRDPSTISREIQRNTPHIKKGYYRAHLAQDRAHIRNQESHRRARLKDPSLRACVVRLLRHGWSPEIIAGHLKRKKSRFRLCHETIYRWIYHDRSDLIPLLVRSHRKRHPRGHRKTHRRLHIPRRISIKDRPREVERRRQIGHWEADTVISRKSQPALQLIVERKTRFTKLKKLPKKGSREVRAAINRALNRYPAIIRRTLTYDNGSENVEHERINKVLGTKSYFCEPFHSWEKATVENTVGLVRRFWPKQTNFDSVSKNKVKYVERWLNNRPRKCLNFQTSAEAFKAAVALTH